LQTLLKGATHAPSEPNEDPVAAGPDTGATLGLQMVVREARLRPEWAYLYPGLEAGVWMVAAQLVPLVLRHRLQGQPTWEFTRRILVDEHFDFRGGRDRDENWSGVLSRVEDA
jgi:hypothetical protein